MKVIAVSSQKGGAGKTTLCRNLACAIPGQVALVDMDEQGTLTAWHESRSKDDLTLVEGISPEGMGSALDELKRRKFDVVIIDTPPSAHEWLADLMSLSDLVVIPVKPTPDDLRAVGDTLALVESANARCCFVVNQAKPRTRLVEEAIRALSEYGKVAPTVIYDRVAYQLAALDGSGVTEKNSKASIEIKQLSSYIVKQLHS